MLDFQKEMFLIGVQQKIAQNPTWADGVIRAVTLGVSDYINKVQDDTSKMIALLLLYHLSETRAYKLSAEDKKRAIQFLSKYFKMDKNE